MAKRHIHRVGDLDSLFLRLEELVLANSGEDEFEEIFQLLIAKIWDERCGKTIRFKAFKNPNDTYKQVVKLLREAEKGWPGICGPGTRPSLTSDHLQVCVEALQKHTISSSSLEMMDSFFEFLVAKNAKGSKGQYFTPRHVVEMCVQILDPQIGEKILDPACGSGSFLIHSLQYLNKNGRLKNSQIGEYSRKHIWGFDIDSRAVKVAKTLMILACEGQSNIIRLNSLLSPESLGLSFDKGPNGSVLTVEDVCRSRIRKHKGFDLILTNPPFAGEVREPQLLRGYTLASGKERIERDVLFLERCVQLLRPGGRLAIVLPHNKFSGFSFTYLRKWLNHTCKILAVVGLGRNIFLPHTHQKASVLFIKKRFSNDRPTPEEPTFFAISENDGKDSKGRPIIRAGKNQETSQWEKLDHDLKDIVMAYKKFSEGLVLKQEI